MADGLRESASLKTYEKLYGVRWEARFHCEPMPAVAARARHREWLNEVEARINNIRAERKGEGVDHQPVTRHFDLRLNLPSEPFRAFSNQH